MPQPDWFANDPLFFQQLEEGHRWALRVGSRLREEGFPVHVTTPTRRERIQNRGDYADEADILVGRCDPLILEVKSRKLDFTDDPASYPHRTAFVDTVKGWDAKQRIPFAVVLVSQLRSGMLVVHVKTTRETWKIEKHRDRKRGIEEEHFYTIDKRRLQSFDALTDQLRNELTQRQEP